MNKELLVKEAFELAYGPIPEGASCHFGYWDGADNCWGHAVIEFATPDDPHNSRDVQYWDSGEECWMSVFEFCSDPLPATSDLSKNPAWCYEEFADHRYDFVIESGEKYEEAQSE